MKKIKVFVVLFLSTFLFKIKAQCSFTTSIIAPNSSCGPVVLKTSSDSTWRQKNNFGGIERTNAVGFSIGNKGYLGLGVLSNSVQTNDFWEYDQLTDSWTQKANFAGVPRENAVGFAINSKGYIGTGFGSAYLNDFWEYDPATNVWLQKADLPGGGRTKAIGFSINEKGYIGTGQSGIYNSDYKNDFWCFNPDSNSWLQKANTPYYLTSSIGFSSLTKGYLATGKFAGGTMPTSIFYEYNPTTNTWLSKANLSNIGRTDAIGFAIAGVFYGGLGSWFNKLNDIWKYDSLNNNWIQRSSFPLGYRNNAVAFSIGNSAYIGTGSDNLSKNDFWQFTASNTTYSWSNGATTPEINITSSGIYSVTVVNENGCIAYATKSITISKSPTLTLAGTTNVSCYGYSNGSATISVSGVHSPYTYTWLPNGGNTNSANGLIAGTHTCLVSNVFGCSQSKIVSISQPNVPFTTSITPLTSTMSCNNVVLHAPPNYYLNVTTNAPGQKRSQAVSFSIGNKGYMGTGSTPSNSITVLKDFWELDPTTDVWTQKADFAGDPRFSAVGFSIDNKGYIGLGTGGPASGYKDFWEYDPINNSWIQKASLPEPSTETKDYISFSINGKGYVGIGGNSNKFWQFDPISNIWLQKPNFPGPSRLYATAFSVKNIGYVCSGYHLGGDDLTDLWAYNPITETWAQKANRLGTGERNAFGFGLKEKGYIGGGEHTDNVGNTSIRTGFIEYDPTTDTWNSTGFSANWPNGLNYATGFGVGDIGYFGTSYDYIMFKYAPKNNITWSTGEFGEKITANASGNYSVNVISENGCIASSSIQVVVNQNPTVAVSAVSNTVCENTTVAVTANGASSYTWSNGANTASIAITPTITETYTVTGTDVNNCSATQTLEVIVDNTCQDVWPGDANSDGVANNLDVLELGLHYTLTGAARTSTSNAWQSFYANNWTGTITNGKNLNHSDCNGDGIINNDDTLAIYNNYGLTHAFKQSQATVTNLEITIVPNQTDVAFGNWGSASVYLGDVTNNITNINGVAFAVDFDNSLIETNNVWIEYETSSFLNASNTNLHFRKLDFTNNKLYTATTHTNNINVTGNGKIATLHYQIKSSLTSDAVLNFGISAANQSNASGVIVPLTSGNTTVNAIASTVGLQTQNNNAINFNLVPNPSKGFVNVDCRLKNDETVKIEVLNSLGQIVYQSQITHQQSLIDLRELTDGVYYVKVSNNNKQQSIKKVMLQK